MELSLLLCIFILLQLSLDSRNIETNDIALV